MVYDAEGGGAGGVADGRVVARSKLGSLVTI